MVGLLPAGDETAIRAGVQAISVTAPGIEVVAETRDGHQVVQPALPATARAPVGRGIARPKSWQMFRRSRISPDRTAVITKAILTLEQQR